MHNKSSRVVTIMKCAAATVLFVLGAVLAPKCEGHTYSLGDCPLVEPMADFDMSKVRWNNIGAKS